MLKTSGFATFRNDFSTIADRHRGFYEHRAATLFGIENSIFENLEDVC
jgi:hypothetical protein